MLICPKCKKEIKYIASKDGEVLMLDIDLQTLVTEKGRIVQGYKIHKCG